jgi:hypothetical protein
MPKINRILTPEDLTIDQCRQYIAEQTRTTPYAAITLAWWRGNGIGPAWRKVKGKNFYRRGDVDRWLRDREAQKAHRGARRKGGQ